MYDTQSCMPLPALTPAEVPMQLKAALMVLPETVPACTRSLAASRCKWERGRPAELTETHLWLGLLWAVLDGLAGSIGH